MRALVRGLAASFANAVTMEPLASPISLELARQQHDAYTQLLKQLLPGGVTELPADDRHPGGQVGEYQSGAAAAAQHVHSLASTGLCTLLGRGRESASDASSLLRLS